MNVVYYGYIQQQTIYHPMANSFLHNFFALYLLTACASGQSIYITDVAYKADLLVYWVKYAYKTKDQAGHWFRVKQEYQADLRVYLTDQP
jgi:hypothetical protein